jgi:hypothetical protein
MCVQSNGCEFSELLKNCDLFEGTIIRAVRTLLGALIKGRIEGAQLALRIC